ncbi:hypothetical protein CXG81DRAFT_18208 [Caulochytrium protostelioides]|uniref:Alpha/beta hydrolase fold-3 domain-containing protein n=1 Tax=Caulochytrium protostelioides TaxID=1555241 RepID=A0A4P9X9S5_9FUNG|nr:hypothetical protein CXG81DRAFT_18208 [Caulochytrium protostelioides]|eukprot:RKP02104.1 hypothetical protein CXG81DRAFT_18208 [Caulochytrium protostelioides]
MGAPARWRLQSTRALLRTPSTPWIPAAPVFRSRCWAVGLTPRAGHATTTTPAAAAAAAAAAAPQTPPQTPPQATGDADPRAAMTVATLAAAGTGVVATGAGRRGVVMPETAAQTREAIARGERGPGLLHIPAWFNRQAAALGAQYAGWGLARTLAYFVHGPACPSWDLPFHLTWSFIREQMAEMHAGEILAIKQAFRQQSATAVGLDAAQRHAAAELHMDEARVVDPPALQLQTRHMINPTGPDGLTEPCWVPRGDDVIAYARSRLTRQDAPPPPGLDDRSPCAAEWVTHLPNRARPTGRVVLYLHGGAYFLLSPKVYRRMAHDWARATGAAVFAVDYRLAPQNPFPCAVIDALAAYRHLIDSCGVRPDQIVVSGDSAGGGLSLALLQAIVHLGWPRPGGAVLFSPWLDLMHTSASHATNAPFDILPTLPEITETMRRVGKPPLPNRPYSPHFHMYADNADLDNPLVSPHYCPDSDLAQLGPMLIQTGDRECLRDEDILFAARAARAQAAAASPTATAAATDPAAAAAAAAGPTSRVALEIYHEQVHTFSHLRMGTRLTDIAWQQAYAFSEACWTDTWQDAPLAARYPGRAGTRGRNRSGRTDRPYVGLGLGLARGVGVDGALVEACALDDEKWLAQFGRRAPEPF